MYGSGSGVSSIWAVGTVRRAIDSETVPWERFRRVGSEDGVRRGVDVAGREVAGAGAGWGGK